MRMSNCTIIFHLDVSVFSFILYISVFLLIPLGASDATHAAFAGGSGWPTDAGAPSSTTTTATTTFADSARATG